MSARRAPAGDKGTADRVEADDGAYWVRLATWQALDREGACMSHCVGDGDYDDLVGSEDLHDDAIWSLRDRDGLSVLTVQIRDQELDDAKGPSNHPPGRGASMQVRHLVAAFKAVGHRLDVCRGTGIVLLQDGRTFRHDRLPPEAQAEQAPAPYEIRYGQPVFRAVADARRAALGGISFSLSTPRTAFPLPTPGGPGPGGGGGEPPRLETAAPSIQRFQFDGREISALMSDRTQVALAGVQGEPEGTTVTGFDDLGDEVAVFLSSGHVFLVRNPSPRPMLRLDLGLTFPMGGDAGARPGGGGGGGSVNGEAIQLRLAQHGMVVTPVVSEVVTRSDSFAGVETRETRVCGWSVDLGGGA